MLRFLNNLKASTRMEELTLGECASADDIREAEVLLIDGEFVQGNANSKRVPPLVNQFNLFMDEPGVLRCISRLKHASIIQESKTLIFLPSNSYYSELVISKAHGKVFHDCIAETLNCCCQKYWILRGRVMAKKYIRRCGKCKWFEGLPLKFNVTPDLPESTPWSIAGPKRNQTRKVMFVYSRVLQHGQST